MILSDRDIFNEIEQGGLKFDPMIEPTQVSTSSIDLRLAYRFTIPRKPVSGVFLTIDPGKVSPEEVFSQYADEVIVSPGEKFDLKPGDFVLGYTLERVEVPDYLAARIEGREFDGTPRGFHSPDRSYRSGKLQRPTQTGNIKCRPLQRVARTWN